MPLVFVHGVATRDTPEYKEAVEQRRRFFQQTVLKHYLGSEQATSLFPLWGRLVPEFPRDNPIIPLPDQSDRFTAFGSNPDAVATGFPAARLVSEDDPPNPILSLARQSFADVIDHLIDQTLRLPEVRDDAEAQREVIAAGVSGSRYAKDNPRPSWIEDVADDDEFVKKLLEELERWEKESAPAAEQAELQAFGAGSKVLGWIRKSANNLKKAVIDIPNDLILERVRPGLTKRMIEFFGDVFYYQSNRGDHAHPGEIPAAVIADLKKARQIASESGEALVVVGHSMGGNVLYDVLTHFEPDLAVDDLVTVGSQASLFKQLELFKTQQGAPGQVSADAKLPAPPGVRRWLNVFDPQDPLSFRFEPTFDGVQDFAFESPGGLTSAHGDYFKRIRFYERLNDHLMQPVK